MTSRACMSATEIAPNMMFSASASIDRGRPRIAASPSDPAGTSVRPRTCRQRARASGARNLRRRSSESLMRWVDTDCRFRGRQYRDFGAFHHLCFRVGVVIVPAQVQHAVHDQMREVVRRPVCAAAALRARRPARRSRRRRAAVALSGARRRPANDNTLVAPVAPITRVEFGSPIVDDAEANDARFTVPCERGARPTPQRSRAAVRQHSLESQLACCRHRCARQPRSGRDAAPSSWRAYASTIRCTSGWRTTSFA